MSAVVGRLEAQNIKLESAGPADALRVVIDTKAPHEFSKFFVDPAEVAKLVDSAGGDHAALVQAIETLSLYSVASKPQADEMRTRGYVKLKYRPIAEWDCMPGAVNAVDTTTTGEVPGEPTPPSTVTLAKRVPDIRGETSAVQVVRAFERVVVLQAKGGADGEVQTGLPD